MDIFTYVITRDYGFAPNPFYGFCTLATCKPRIRGSASIGDWIIGTGSASREVNMGNQVIYAMKVEEKISFTEYWNDERFMRKKPVMNGSKRQNYGDNIYRYDEIKNKLVQVDSHHSLPNGKTNLHNFDKDTSKKFVLISREYWYFGKEAPEIPKKFRSEFINNGIGYKKVKTQVLKEDFIDWLRVNYEQGFQGKPLHFNGGFKRYNGVS